MKILKYLFFLILIVIIGTAIYFGTKDGAYEITDSKMVNAPVEVVFDKVNNLKSWETWGPWKQDSTMKITYAEKTSGEGANISWTGDMDGSLTTVKVIPNKEIQQDLTLNTPHGERHPKLFWKFEEIENGTKVTWTMKGTHSLLDKVYFSISGSDFDGQIHQINVEGLDGIEEEVLSDMKKYLIHVDGITEFGGGYYMYNTTVAKQSEMGERMGPMMAQVSGYMKDNNLQPAGMPFTIYNSIDDLNGTVIFSACIPIKEKVITPEGSPVVCGFMEPVSAVKTTLKGDYSNLKETYSKALAYMAKNNLQMHPTLKMFEVYSINPDVAKNPADWVTEVYIPVLKQETTAELGI